MVKFIYLLEFQILMNVQEEVTGVVTIVVTPTAVTAVTVSQDMNYTIKFIASPLSRRLSRPAAAICAKPASRPRKFRLSRELAEKNIRLSRRENSGLNAKKSITKVFGILKLIVNRHGLRALPSLVGAVMFSLCLCIKCI